VTLNLAETSVVKSRPSVPHVVNYYYYLVLIMVTVSQCKGSNYTLPSDLW